mmetsp:Transcript_1315/g.2409  ORF Transcript_1315/g.2409 Transcript_1315/m.2409 type:complete len:88 (+) Transcript_1315:133-396(+)
MGKNQQHKMRQAGRGGGGGGDGEEPGTGPDDGMVDAGFHSPAWHAARLAALQPTVQRMSWEDFKKQQEEEKQKLIKEAADEDALTPG